MNYFYDHQTDSVSVMLGEFLDFAGSEQLAPGVIAYLDGTNHVIAIEFRGAAGILDTKGLVPMYSRPMSSDELHRRLSITQTGELAWRAVRPRLPVAV